MALSLVGKSRSALWFNGYDWMNQFRQTLIFFRHSSARRHARQHDNFIIPGECLALSRISAFRSAFPRLSWGGIRPCSRRCRGLVGDSQGQDGSRWRDKLEQAKGKRQVRGSQFWIESRDTKVSLPRWSHKPVSVQFCKAKACNLFQQLWTTDKANWNRFQHQWKAQTLRSTCASCWPYGLEICWGQPRFCHQGQELLCESN